MAAEAVTPIFATGQRSLDSVVARIYRRVRWLARCSSLAIMKGSTMRWFHLAIVVLLVSAAVIFALQNLEVVTMSFLGFSARVPLALLAAGIYVAGAATGGSLLALVRRSYERSRIGAARPS